MMLLLNFAADIASMIKLVCQFRPVMCLWAKGSGQGFVEHPIALTARRHIQKFTVISFRIRIIDTMSKPTCLTRQITAPEILQ